MKEALYWLPLEDKKVKCVLCPHECIIRNNKTGICNIRQNKDGILYALMYEQVSSVNMDPIEKKPLYHFYPGTKILSIGTLGCNFSCEFCQNWHLIESQVPIQTISSEKIVELAKKHKSIGIAYTYNEPFIWFEYVLETAKLARKDNLKNVLVTNGHYNPEPFEELLPYIDAMNIDLKYMNPQMYKKISKGNRDPVLETIKKASRKCHVEITNLVVPGLNDSEEDIKQLVDFVSSVNPFIPLHFSRYHPAYKLKTDPTPPETLEMCYKIASEKLKYVFVGNIVLSRGNNSICHNCQNILVNRLGYYTQISGLTKDGKCTKCGTFSYIIN